MRPDYGTHLHARRISPEVKLVFYDVPVDHVTLTDAPSLTTTVNKAEEGIEYAISFDFTDEASVQLLALMPASAHDDLKRAAEADTVRGRTVAFEPPLTVTLEAHLGSLQRSPQEIFAPLLVHRVA
jgi:hypothetical protein